MTKVVAYTRADGGLSLLYPAEGARLASSVTRGEEVAVFDPPAPAEQFRGVWPVEGAAVEWAETEDAFIARIAAKDVPQGTPYRVVESGTLPQDRSVRAAWRLDAEGAVTVDPVVAEAIGASNREAAAARGIKERRLKDARKAIGKGATEDRLGAVEALLRLIEET